jgi:hypothetical protein
VYCRQSAYTVETVVRLHIIKVEDSCGPQQEQQQQTATAVNTWAKRGNRMLLKRTLSAFTAAQQKATACHRK